MKKRIWLALLPIALLWCGCSEDEYDHTREITAVASTADVTVSQSTRTAITDTSFGGKDARVLATATSGVYSTLYCNGIMNFKDKDVAARYSGTYYGKNSFPESGAPQTVWLSGLYPATGWGCDTGETIAGGVVTYTVDGKTDIMYAKEEENHKGGSAAALTFEHLLTLLKINLETLGTARIKVHEITLIGTGAAGGLVHPVCSISLNSPSAVNFIGGQGTTTLPCWLTASETEFIDKNIDPTDTDDAEAYILAPPLSDGEVVGEEDYTLLVAYTIDAEEEETVDVPVNLQKGATIGDYAGDTAGRSFVITLRFSGGDVAATAKIEDWVPAGDGVSENLQAILPELTPQGETPAYDGLTNCYVVVPGEELVFPVKRAYEYISGTDFSNTLRTGGEYTGRFTAEVLWMDAGVINETKVYGSGKESVVALKTNSGANGNAVVAIKKINTDDIVWSYHIWVIDFDPRFGDSAELSSDASCSPYGTSLTLMACDLGDLTKDVSMNVNGLVYQWARKDPFDVTRLLEGQDGFHGVEITAETGNRIYAITNPTSLIETKDNHWFSTDDYDTWGMDGGKFENDPCPYDYHVLDTEYTTFGEYGLVDLDFEFRAIQEGISWECIKSNGHGKYWITKTAINYSSLDDKMTTTACVNKWTMRRGAWADENNKAWSYTILDDDIWGFITVYPTILTDEITTLPVRCAKDNP
jgi:hypothetical protein